MVLVGGGLGVMTWVCQHKAANAGLAARRVEDAISQRQTNLTDLQHDLDVAARLALEKTQAGRQLSHEQSLTIRDVLLTLPQRRAQVFCPLHNDEAYEFAKQITRALESAHWNTGAGTHREENAPPDTGLTIFVRGNEPEGAEELRDTLHKAGIRANINVRHSMSGIIRVYVGPRP